MYSLIASDLDGTLLLPDDRIGEFSRSVLNRLVESGRHVVIATGRSQPDVESILRDYALPVHLITSNGARITSACKSLTASEHLPQSVVRTLLDATKADRDLVINAYCDSRWITNADSQLLEDFNHNDDFQPTVLDVEAFPVEAIEKVFFIHRDKDHEALVLLDGQLKALVGSAVHSTFSAPWCLEMMASSVSKGNALKKLAAFLDVPMSQCIAFGDGMNDVEMLTVAGKGLIMGTAHHKVMQALPEHETIGACTEESVARYLSAHLLN
ncbi:Cof-type HAD-IIB family hydrolase [Pseudomonas gingeri]|uniref:Cof-type HAD-IIB family hydrolase n=1 Tax=Pseudomonas gingeri TaxID=117681 RepID=UPI0015A25854|nr:Cof-type HAD-IIB family hydrolase [Pseudomonas gingeri]NVZ99741.1 Cof-type HAD-IIB family hydrolase [Pseudomonas gingeri]NWA16581.1 Cof-type HAD-IIB family hydrolase [Pseudomonas gingeri]NWA54033.1 Cof-type HAD-IIB family hydrolase [Pseudomonas gingeri]NWA94265.1 Cof-type HAD-IIB family hydrolase [Pseudomonas gingeri]NWB01835.1 Cof-type HAD-IIB family hydrolase [Pseudomonas gingeri]